jgi:hypothetical protein
MQSRPGKPIFLVKAPSPLAHLVAELDPDIPQRLLAEHVSDRTGCCPLCSLPQGGPQRWPCTLCLVAFAASGLLRISRLPDR